MQTNPNLPKKVKLAVLGDIMLDRYLSGFVERISPEAPTPIVDLKSVKDVVGGASNVMNNATGLGAKVWGFGVIGNDEEGKTIKKILKKNMIDTSNIITEKERPTTLKCRIISGNNQLLRFDREQKFSISNASQSKILRGLENIIDDINIIIISDYEKGLLSKSLVQRIKKIARKHKVPILVDGKFTNCNYYSCVDYFKMNLFNTKMALGINSNNFNSELASKQLSEMLKCNNVIVTQGKDGMTIFSSKKSTHIPSQAKDVFDVTGAGDVMTAALGVFVSCGYDLILASKLGTLASGLSISKVGTYRVTLRELTESLNHGNAYYENIKF